MPMWQGWFIESLAFPTS